MSDPCPLLEPLLELHDAIRTEVVAATERRSLRDLAGVSREEAGDTIYAIDTVAEAIIDRFAARLEPDHSFVLIAEGIPGGKRVHPRETREEDATWRIIIDPIDGTRGLMYQKRSAWILTGVAPNRGRDTSLQDVVLAAQTEIPLRKQHLSDQLHAVKGGGVTTHRYNRLTGEREAMAIAPSTATTIAHGYAGLSRFFPGSRAELAAIDDEVVLATLGPAQPGKAQCFEDQYASTGGQLYELMAGHDRFIADLRPLVRSAADGATSSLGLCCHPYDICTALIAAESGVIITDAHGGALDVPLNVDTDVAWVGYANDAIRRQIEPLLQMVLRTRGWI